MLATEAEETGNKALKPQAFVVDHALRPESRQEAEHALHLAAQLGLQPHLLVCNWPQGPPSTGRLQKQARLARYEVLRQACEHHSCTALLTGHQAGEQHAIRKPGLQQVPL